MFQDDNYYWLKNLVPKFSGTAFVCGEKSMQDSQWLAQQGINAYTMDSITHEYVQIPGPNSRNVIQCKIEDILNDKELPENTLGFDLIILSGSLEPVHPDLRESAIKKLFELLNPEGILAILYRRNKSGVLVPHKMKEGEIRKLTEKLELDIVSADQLNSQLTAGMEEWSYAIYRKARDCKPSVKINGADVIEHIIHHDRKRSTYKLGLLRSLYRISRFIRCSGDFENMCIKKNENSVTVPSGMVGLYWLRIYIPLMVAELPQHPKNQHASFDTEDFKRLTHESNLNLRMDSIFEGYMAELVHKNLQTVVETIETNPAKYTKYKGTRTRIFNMDKLNSFLPKQEIQLNCDYLFKFGEFRFPLEIWQVMITGDNWMENEIVDEWSSMIMKYLSSSKSGKMSKHPSEQEKYIRSIAAAMMWVD